MELECDGRSGDAYLSPIPHLQFPRYDGPEFTERSGAVRQYGLGRVALSRLKLGGVLRVELDELARHLGLTVEASTSDGQPVRMVYFEDGDAAYGLAHYMGMPPDHTQVYVYLDPFSHTDGDFRGRNEFLAFARLAGCSRSDIVFPMDLGEYLGDLGGVGENASE